MTLLNVLCVCVCVYVCEYVLCGILTHSFWFHLLVIFVCMHQDGQDADSETNVDVVLSTGIDQQSALTVMQV